MGRAAFAAVDQLANPLAAFAPDLAEELGTALAAHHFAALAADLAVELGAVALLGGLAALLPQTAITLSAQGLFADDWSKVTVK